MIVVWGSKIVRRYVGRVADFCPICRKVRAFRLTRIGEAGHLWYISITSGRLLGHEKACETCGIKLQAVEARYKRPTKDRHLDVEMLAERTHPNLEEEHAERLALEKRLQAGKLTPEERRAAIEEPFVILAPEIEEEAASRWTQIRGSASRGCAYIPLGAILAVILWVVLGADRDGIIPLLIVYGILGAALWLYIWIGQVPRYLRKRIYPKLARSLGPLDPKPEEIQDVLDDAADEGLCLAKVLDAQQIVTDIHGLRPDTYASDL